MHEVMLPGVFVAPTAIIESLDIEAGTKIWHFSHISKGAIIGKNCTIGEGVYIGPNVMIGDNCRIQNHAQIFEGVLIENDVFIGPCVCFTNDRNPPTLPFTAEKTLVKSGSAIGANSTIVCGIEIDGFVGAGSVVTKSFKGKVRGNPARGY